MEKVLVVSKNEEARKTLTGVLGEQYRVFSENRAKAWMDRVVKDRYEITFIDIGFLQKVKEQNEYRTYKKVLQIFKKAYPTVSIVVMTQPDQIRPAVDIVRAGANNYLTFPLDAAELKYVVDSIYESDRLESELDYFRSSFWPKENLDLFRTKSPSMAKVLEKVSAVSQTRTTVLLNGETGTGKGVMAKLIHSQSNRRDNLFVNVHCGAIPENLVESELFGHEKGAFTGATQRNLGKFEVAQGGSIFLDEVGTISPSVQIKLLNVLQERNFQRVGGRETIDADVRIIAATNIDLKKMCDDGLLRRDLYYRLNVFSIELPPLRERREDIPLLSEVFLQRLNSLYPKDIRGIHTDVLDAFQGYSWPGNIREMEHLIERAYILEKSPVLTPDSFPAEIASSDLTVATIPLDTEISLAQTRKRAVADIEQRYIQETLSRNNGRINRTAAAAGITTRQLNKLMKKYGINKNDFKPSRGK